MSKQKKAQATAPTQVTLQSVPTELKALETGLGLTGAVFTRVERVRTRTSSQHVPDVLIEMLATHAETNGGMVAGLPFDAAGARAMLAKVSTARSAATAARQFAQRVEDDAIQGRSDVADVAFGLYRALQRVVRSPQGKPEKDSYEKMRSAVRAHHKARKTKGTSSGAPAQAGSPAEAPSPVVAPAQAGATTEPGAAAQASADHTAAQAQPVAGPSPAQH